MAPRGSRDDEGVVDPEDLDITKNEQVHELRDGQYVIATGDEANDALEDLDDIRSDLRAEVESASSGDPRAALVDHMKSLSAANGFVIAGRFDGAVQVSESSSDDPGAVFRDLLRWYAANVDGDTPSPEVLGILCLAGGVQVRYPVRTVVDLLSAHDLSPDDSIRDLVDAVRDDGLALPPDGSSPE